LAKDVGQHLREQDEENIARVGVGETIPSPEGTPWSDLLRHSKR
jgi:hypothetical protein